MTHGTIAGVGARAFGVSWRCSLDATNDEKRRAERRSYKPAPEMRPPPIECVFLDLQLWQALKTQQLVRWFGNGPFPAALGRRDR